MCPMMVSPGRYWRTKLWVSGRLAAVRDSLPIAKSLPLIKATVGLLVFKRHRDHSRRISLFPAPEFGDRRLERWWVCRKLYNRWRTSFATLRLSLNWRLTRVKLNCPCSVIRVLTFISNREDRVSRLDGTDTGHSL